MLFFSLPRVFNTDIIRPGNDVCLKYLAVSHAAVRVYDGRSDSSTPSSCVRWCRKGRASPWLLGCDIAAYNPYPTAFPYGNSMVLHFYQQQEISTTKTVHKVINKGLKMYV